MSIKEHSRTTEYVKTSMNHPPFIVDSRFSALFLPLLRLDCCNTRSSYVRCALFKSSLRSYLSNSGGVHGFLIFFSIKSSQINCFIEHTALEGNTSVSILFGSNSNTLSSKLRVITISNILLRNLN